MPLDDEKFLIGGEGSEPVERALLGFFKAHRFTAYLAEELLFELGAVGVISTPDELHQGLDVLVGRKRVFVRTIDGGLYYRYDNSIGLHRPG